LILLPGGSEQVKYFLNHYGASGKNILMIGAGTVEAAKIVLRSLEANIEIIVEDHESLMVARLASEKMPAISSKLMDFEHTDFKNNQFDAVYAQASVSDVRRNKIIKEIKRILKPDGIICIGEVVNLTKQPPPFVLDIWNHSDLNPLFIDEVSAYYEQRNFEIFWEKDLSHTLKDFYSDSAKLLNENLDKLDTGEKSYNKRILNKISHESNAYLNLGGSLHIGFKLIMARKNEY